MALKVFTNYFLSSKLTHSVSDFVHAFIVVLPTMISFKVQLFRLLCTQLSTLHLIEGFIGCIFSSPKYIIFSH